MVLFSFGFLGAYHIGIGGGGKVFQDVGFWKYEVLDIKPKDREVLTFVSEDARPEKGASCRGRGRAI